MSDIAIKVEDLGKLYRLGEVGTGTLSQDLKRWWALTRGKEDPFGKLGETNDRTVKGDSEFVWALKDINFEVFLMSYNPSIDEVIYYLKLTRYLELEKHL